MFRISYVLCCQSLMGALLCVMLWTSERFCDLHKPIFILPRQKEMSSSVQLFRDQKYHELKRQCIQQGRLFEDPEFPASDESLFYQRAPPKKVEWKRPKVKGTPLAMRCCLCCTTPTVFSVLNQLSWSILPLSFLSFLVSV